jgi:hypothetical protein
MVAAEAQNEMHVVLPPGLLTSTLAMSTMKLRALYIKETS